jgi:DnaJ-class molecular chaperone
MSVLKIKGLTTIQIFQLWRLLKFLKNSGRFSYYGKVNQPPSSNSLTLVEAYKILGLEQDCTNEQVKKAANNIQKKIHPDVSPETARLSALVNEARDIILKNNF